MNNSYLNIIETLDKAFDHFNNKYCEGTLNKPVIVILSRGRRACLGWHWSQKWKVGEEVKTEIMIAAETLDRPWENILETLLHEMVHLSNAQHNLKDCNAQQYHNKNFRNTAMQIFHLNVEKMHQKGYALTSLKDKSAADVQEFISEQKLTPIQLKRIVPIRDKAYKRQYNINVSKEDYEWFQQYKEENGLSSKDAFTKIKESNDAAQEYELTDYR